MASSCSGEDSNTYSISIPAFGRSLNVGVTCPFLCRVSQEMQTASGDVKDVLDGVTARLFPVSPGEEADGRTVNST